MILTPTQNQKLLTALIKAYDQEDLKFMLQSRLDQRLDFLTLGAKNFQILVATVIYTAKEQGWVTELIEAAHDYKPTKELKECLQILRELQPADEDESDPFLAIRLWNQIPFIDRDDTRDYLREMARPNGFPTVMVVTGDKGTGKSHTYVFINYLAQELKTFQVRSLDFTKEVYSQIAPDDFIVGLMDKMGIRPTTDLPERPTQDARWVGKLCDWFSGYLSEAGGLWWLVLDGVDQVELNKYTRDAILRLAEMAGGDIPNIRIILIDYSDAIVGNRRVVYERLAANVGSNDVHYYLSNCLAQRRVKITELVRKTLEGHVAEIVATVKREKRLSLLEDALHSAENELYQLYGHGNIQ